jgi:UDP-2-acetamido-2-deoxy-ribo-hexuluronate aminotransferase
MALWRLSGEVTSPCNFIDLKPQYAALKPSILRRLEAVLDHGQYILGP